ncbi:MAG: hypothetical protein J5795_06155 [Lachnospiraceae bacterium]|nr:hypothetical protein [Lachnospiraceae bacterium]MBO7630835.1 hypothetical protein [Lachnospiraceae bacterium]
MARNGGYGGRNGGAGGDGSSGGVKLAIAGLFVFALVYFFGDRADAKGALASVLSVVKVVSIVAIVGFFALIIALIGFAWWAARKEEKRKEEERKQQILNTPLETFGDLETQQLMDKYDGKTPDGGQVFAGDGKKESVNPYSVTGNPYEDKEKVQAGR